MKPVILDISRSIRRIFRPTPTGIDRIEIAYIQWLLNRNQDSPYDDGFEAWFPIFGWIKISNNAALKLSKHSEQNWQEQHNKAHLFSKDTISLLLSLLRPAPRNNKTPALRLSVAHNNPKSISARRKLSSKNQGKLIQFLHDLIPVEHPQYARTSDGNIHMERATNMAKNCDAIICNSEYTRASFNLFACDIKDKPRSLVVPFGSTAPQKPNIDNKNSYKAKQPYFLYVSTIEPRKNHAMLCDIWVSMAKILPQDKMPKLYLIGRRGWDCDAIFDRLQNDDILSQHIIHISDMSDSELYHYYNNATAILMPSFVEGYGLPVAEALEYGLPVLASDIAAHREVGKTAAKYLSPHDADVWRREIIKMCASDYCLPNAWRNRIDGWKAKDWNTHFKTVEKFMEQL